ncbi:MAG TPA: hypothetical protein VFW50_17455 [Streptosporangiaceae bacterium]|nr:hypothetical protein [Streptosporangiaceae bacterium]
MRDITDGAPDLADVPEPLIPLITECLAKDPAARPSLDDILKRCAALGRPAPPRKPAPSRPPLPPRPGRLAADPAARCSAPTAAWSRSRHHAIDQGSRLSMSVTAA